MNYWKKQRPTRHKVVRNINGETVLIGPTLFTQPFASFIRSDSVPSPQQATLPGVLGAALNGEKGTRKEKYHEVESHTVHRERVP